MPWNILSFLLVLTCAFGHLSLHAQFEERALEAGVDHHFYDYTSIAGGIALFDMNNDNLLDIFVTGGTQTEKLYINNGATFDRVINYLGPEDFDYYDIYANAVASGDVNGDGFDDLIICTFWDDPPVLFINDQNGKFDAIPGAQSGFTATDWMAGAALGDIDEDGLLDVFMVNYIDTIRINADTSSGEVNFAHVGNPNHLFINQGGNAFSEQSANYGIELRRNSLAACFTDYDQDGDADIYVINDFGQFTGANELYENQLPFMDVDEVAVERGADVAFYGMGVAIGDYDNDLDLDYYMTNIGNNALLQNDGNGNFTDVAGLTGVLDGWTDEGRLVGWGTGFLDYDNDGDLDLYVSNGYLQAASEIFNPWYNPNSLYRNDGNGSFTDVSISMGFSDASQYRGSAFGDLDNDGLLDIILIPTNGNEPPDTGAVRKVKLYYNVTQNDNNWIKFRLKGVLSNSNGYGAHVYLYDNSGRIQLRECDGGSSHASSNSPFIHFGIGTASAVDSVVIFWPNGLVQTIYDPGINQLHSVTEGQMITAAHSEIWDATLEVFPNPFVNEFHLRLPSLEERVGIRIEISTTDGRLLFNQDLQDKDLTIDASNFPNANLVLRIFDGAQLISHRILLKQQD